MLVARECEFASAETEDLRRQFADLLGTTTDFGMDMIASLAGEPLLAHCHGCGPHQPVEFYPRLCGKCGNSAIKIEEPVSDLRWYCEWKGIPPES